MKDQLEKLKLALQNNLNEVITIIDQIDHHYQSQQDELDKRLSMAKLMDDKLQQIEQAKLDLAHEQELLEKEKVNLRQKGSLLAIKEQKLKDRLDQVQRMISDTEVL
jgi:hypothetical protein